MPYLALVMGIGPLVHYSVSALGPVLVPALELSATQFGSLWFASFGVAGLLTISGGKVSDRVGMRSLLVGVFACALAAVLIVGSARSYAWLLVALILSGVAQSVSNPATNRLVVTHVSPGRQGVTLGMKQSGVQVSQFAAGLALPSAAAVVGWRPAVLLCGVVALAGMFQTCFVVPTAEPATAGVDHQSRVSLDPQVWWLTGYAFGIGVVMQATNVYLPLYAHERLSASATRAGLMVAVLGGFGVLARFAWGRIADRVEDLRVALRILALLATAAMLAVLLAGVVGEWLLWVAAGAFSISVLAANVVLMLAVVRSAPREHVGHATGWVSLGLYLGFMVGPLGMGLLVDFASFGLAWSTLVMAAGALVVLTLVWRPRSMR